MKESVTKLPLEKMAGTFPVEISVSEYSNKHGGTFGSSSQGRYLTTAEGDRAFLAAIVESSDEAIIGKIWMVQS